MPDKRYTNPRSERLVYLLSNTSWVAWDQENDQPETYAGSEPQTIEFHADGGCVAGMHGGTYEGTWAIRELAGQPFLHLLFGNEDDSLAITVRQIGEGNITLSSSKYSDLLFTGEIRPKCYKKRPLRDQPFLAYCYRRLSASDFVKVADELLRVMLRFDPQVWQATNQERRLDELNCLNRRLAECSSTEEKRGLYLLAMHDGVL